MQGHGNLFWNIKFDAGAKDADYCDRTHIDVCGYDYKDMFERAQKEYTLARKTGLVVDHFSLYLRFDETSEDRSLHFSIIRTWHLADPDNPGAFFCGVPEVSMKGLCCTA